MILWATTIISPTGMAAYHYHIPTVDDYVRRGLSKDMWAHDMAEHTANDERVATWRAAGHTACLYDVGTGFPRETAWCGGRVPCPGQPDWNYGHVIIDGGGGATDDPQSSRSLWSMTE